MDFPHYAFNFTNYCNQLYLQFSYNLYNVLIYLFQYQN
jgi:hypothetical protein